MCRWLFVVVCCLPAWLLADTTYVRTGAISGRWSAERSPYVIQGHVFIRPADTLQIGPGVAVLFQISSGVSVQGLLEAHGTAADSVLFSQLDTTANLRWQGLQFVPGGPPCRLDYCRIEYTQWDNYTAAIRVMNRRVDLNHCTVYRAGNYGIVATGPDTLHLSGCALLSNGTTPHLGGGIRIEDSTVAYLDSCLIRANITIDGAGLWVERAELTLTNSLIEDNHSTLWGAGIFYDDAWRLDISHCRFLNNRARHGGALHGLMDDHRTARIDHCLFAGNGRPWDGGASGGCGRIGGGSHSFTNCTFAGNLSADGAVFALAGPAEFNSCAFAFNGPGNAFLPMTGAWANAEYCAFFGNRIDNTNPFAENFLHIIAVNPNGDPCDQYFNIIRDPLFADTTAGDYHLQAGSPCINAGDPESPRDPDSTIADIGMFYYPRPQETGTELPELPGATALLPVMPNPFNASARLTFSLEQAGEVRLAVYDLLGRQVAVLAAEPMAAGTHTRIWHAQAAPSGTYFAVLEVNGVRSFQKLLLLK